MARLRAGRWAALASVMTMASLMGALLLGCATYRDDLDRAMGHYNANEYDHSLALLEVLEPDLDSLSTPQRAQYEYYRGMSHFRLNQKFDARHWLGRSAAREKANAGSLSAEEKGRLEDTLAKLNQERYGDANLDGTKSCTVKEDCSSGEDCVNGACTASAATAPPAEGKPEAEGGADKAPEPAAQPEPPAAP